MPARVTRTERISLPDLRLIGKKGFNWAAWWSNDWFTQLEGLGTAVDVDYVGCVRGDSYWIGMLFPAGMPVPDGFAALDFPGGDWALCYIYGKEDDGSLYGASALTLCRTAMAESSLVPASGDYLERYNCPRFTTPDANGCVTLDYLLPLI